MWEFRLYYMPFLVGTQWTMNRLSSPIFLWYNIYSNTKLLSVFKVLLMFNWKWFLNDVVSCYYYIVHYFIYYSSTFFCSWVLHFKLKVWSPRSLFVGHFKNNNQFIETCSIICQSVTAHRTIKNVHYRQVSLIVDRLYYFSIFF